MNALFARRTMRHCAGVFDDDDDDDIDEPLLTNGRQMHPRPKNVFALERTYLTWTHMAVTVRRLMPLRSCMNGPSRHQHCGERLCSSPGCSGVCTPACCSPMGDTALCCLVSF